LFGRVGTIVIHSSGRSPTASIIGNRPMAFTHVTAAAALFVQVSDMA
jgi:hypothetical protein